MQNHKVVATFKSGDSEIQKSYIFDTSQEVATFMWGFRAANNENARIQYVSETQR